MIDQSHIDSFLAYEDEQNVFHISASAFEIDVFPPEIETFLGNELNFKFHTSFIDEDDLIVAEYHQLASPLILYLHMDN